MIASPLISSNSFLSSRTPETKDWPEQPGGDAFAGLAGEVVAEVDPHSEADQVAILANFLIAFGSAVGSGPHFMVGATRHYPREYVALVGKTSKARKGDSWQPIRTLFQRVDGEWLANVANGLSTGEGLIYAVRDAVETKEPIKEKGRIVGYQNVLSDEGVEDKRLLIVESELAKVTAVIQRQGNSLSPVLRAGWDTGDMRVMTRANPLKATGAHISLLAHITIDELTRELSEVSAANGFANRFIWLAVRRSKLLPEPDPFEGPPVERLATWVGSALDAARTVTSMERDAEASALWRSVYGDLAVEKDGLTGSLLARAEAHVLRLSMLYALVDASRVIRLEHLTAALELWAYSERSVEHIFADVLGDPVADAILRALKVSESLARTDISAIFSRNESAARIASALQHLQAKGLAQVGHEETAGRSKEIWRAVG